MSRASVPGPATLSTFLFFPFPRRCCPVALSGCFLYINRRGPVARRCRRGRPCASSPTSAVSDRPWAADAPLQSRARRQHRVRRQGARHAERRRRGGAGDAVRTTQRRQQSRSSTAISASGGGTLGDARDDPPRRRRPAALTSRPLASPGPDVGASTDSITAVIRLRRRPRAAGASQTALQRRCQKAQERS